MCRERKRKKFCSKKTYFLLIYVSAEVPGYNIHHVHAQHLQRKEHGSDPLELEMQVLVSCLLRVLGPEFSTRARVLLTTELSLSPSRTPFYSVVVA